MGQVNCAGSSVHVVEKLTGTRSRGFGDKIDPRALLPSHAWYSLVRINRDVIPRCLRASRHDGICLRTVSAVGDPGPPNEAPSAVVMVLNHRLAGIGEVPVFVAVHRHLSYGCRRDELAVMIGITEALKEHVPFTSMAIVPRPGGTFRSRRYMQNRGFPRLGGYWV